jgi:hypothetical protein
VPERVALSLPILQDMIEYVLFQQHANPDVLLVVLWLSKSQA